MFLHGILITYPSIAVKHTYTYISLYSNKLKYGFRIAKKRYVVQIIPQIPKYFSLKVFISFFVMEKELH